MGNIMSSDCLNLKDYLSADDYAKLIGEDYTVVRTSGEEQTGFHIPDEEHGCQKSGTGFCPAAHATRISPSAEPKFFLTTERILCPKGCAEDHDHNDHVCGWRVCSPKRRTFWPSRMTGNEDEKQAWFKWLDEVIAPIPFPTAESREKERVDREYEAKQKEKAIQLAQYEVTEAAMRNMLKVEAEKVKAKTGCQCASVLDCKPCVYGAQGRPLDS